jgi:PBSX family phage terminase large subunit
VFVQKKRDRLQPKINALEVFICRFQVSKNQKEMNDLAPIRETVNLSHRDLFAPSFYRVFNDIRRKAAREYWLKGGRGSTKSTFVSNYIVGAMIENAIAYKQGLIPRKELSHAVIYRKVGADLRDSVFTQIMWSLEKMNVHPWFDINRSSMRIKFIPTGQQILFRGLDDAIKSKSIKAPFGYFKYLWFEELTQFTSMDEIRSVGQSVRRGGHEFVTFCTYNPPMTMSNWVNVEANTPKDGRLVYHSDYRTVPREWLGEDWFLEADALKKQNPRIYAHEYLGAVTGTGGNVFQNLDIRDGRPTLEELNSFDRRCFGIDWGFAVDPFVWVACHYDRKRRILYIFDEIYSAGLRNNESAALVKGKKSVMGYNFVYADSAEPKSIADFQAEGINCLAVSKSPDSVRHGMHWLQSLCKIVIWKGGAPNCAREFSTYEYEKNRDNQFISAYPDKNNHTIDAVRYANEQHITKGGLF